MDSRRFGWNLLQPHEHLDLRWADSLTCLRYLHIKAVNYTNVRTLQALGLLVVDAAVAGTAAAPLSLVTLPLFIGRVEEFGLDVHESLIDPVRYADELSFNEWSICAAVRSASSQREEGTGITRARSTCPSTARWPMRCCAPEWGSTAG